MSDMCMDTTYQIGKERHLVRHPGDTLLIALAPNPLPISKVFRTAPGLKDNLREEDKPTFDAKECQVPVCTG